MGLERGMATADWLGGRRCLGLDLVAALALVTSRQILRAVQQLHERLLDVGRARQVRGRHAALHAEV